MTRLIRLAGAAGLMGLAATIGAEAARAAPAMVIEVESGRILHAEEPTRPWFPASLTKLMTAYVVLDEIRAGRLSLDTALKVSKHASSRPPSKIGLKPGQEITVDNALKMIMVKSANDVSVVIAEGVAGSVDGFSAMMNRAAARLGMVDSHFVNPNGLPDPRLRTSARDMALLGRALWREFPRHRDLWGIGAIQLGSRVMRTHNGLIGRYHGADGMKTGFVCASGFNVVASASRGGQRLIAVVMGEPSAAERTARTAQLFEKAFAGSGWGGGSIESLGQGVGEPPDMRATICNRRNRSKPVWLEEEDTSVPISGLPGANSGNPALEGLIGRPAVSSSTNVAAAMYAPRQVEFDPIRVFIGRSSGSDRAIVPPALARRNATETPPREATAFAPTGAAPAAAAGGPISLQGAVAPTPPARPASLTGAARQKAKPQAKPKPKPKPQAAQTSRAARP